MRHLFAVIFILLFRPVFSQHKQHNVLFFLVDDLGWSDIGTNGSQLYETPNIDALATESVRFSNAYSAYPRCVPSRHAMITGRHPARNGQEDGSETPPEMVTLAEAMKSNGYGTFFAGKWHLGHTEATWPHNQGFDVNKGGCDSGAPASYFFPFHDSKRSKNNKPYYGLENGKKGEYITDRLTDETIRYIEDNHPRKTGKPFFAYLAHYAVHTPLQAKPEKVDYYKKKISGLTFEGEPYQFGIDGRAKMWQDNAVYAAMVESMDESLGKIVSKLKELGLYDNTIIVFTSDHGGLSNSGSENNRELATTNKPLRAGKGHIYEGGIKVPVFVRWPGVTKSKSTTDWIITGMDYFPSILEMCGLPLIPEAHLDGISFAPALKGNDTNKNRTFYWHQTRSRPASTGDLNSSVIRTGNMKLHHFLNDNRLELYDLDTDPYERNNLAGSQADVVAKMKRQLDGWKKEVNAAQLKPGPGRNTEEDEGNETGGIEQLSPMKSPAKRAGKVSGQGNQAGRDKQIPKKKSAVPEKNKLKWTVKTRKETKAELLTAPGSSSGENPYTVRVSGSTGEIVGAMLAVEMIPVLNNSLEINLSAFSDRGKTLKIQVQFLSREGKGEFSARTFELAGESREIAHEFRPKEGFEAQSANVRLQFGASDGTYTFEKLTVK